MAEVRIDGVLYVPVSEANPSAAAIEGALIEQWWGTGWEAHRAAALRSLRVVVSDSFDADEGKSIPEFIARILANIESEPMNADQQLANENGLLRLAIRFLHPDPVPDPGTLRMAQEELGEYGAALLVETVKRNGEPDE